MRRSDSLSETTSISASSTASFQVFVLPFAQVPRVSKLRDEVLHLKRECGENRERLRAELKELRSACDQKTFEFMNTLLQHYEEYDNEEVEEEFNNVRQEYMEHVARECNAVLQDDVEADDRLRSVGATGGTSGGSRPGDSHSEQRSRSKTSSRSPSVKKSGKQAHSSSKRERERSEARAGESPERPLVSAGSFQIGIAGMTGRGKSSLVNALLGADVEQTGAIELQQPIRVHVHPRAEALVLWEVPLPEPPSSERAISSWFHANALRTLDALVLVVGTSLSEPDRLVAKLASQQYNIPVLFVRSKADADLEGHVRKRFVKRLRDLNEFVRDYEGRLLHRNVRAYMRAQIDKARLRECSAFYYLSARTLAGALPISRHMVPMDERALLPDMLRAAIAARLAGRLPPNFRERQAQADREFTYAEKYVPGLLKAQEPQAVKHI